MAKIILVDDEARVCELMQSYLEAKGYEVVSAGTCKDAIYVTEKEKPDIMLLDRRLPDGDGLDLLEKIRQFNSDVKVLVISAYDMTPTDHKRMKDLKVIQFIRKPIMVDDLSVLLKKIS